MSYLLTHLPIAVFLASIVVSFLSAAQAVYGVRAKYRVKAILARDERDGTVSATSDHRILVERAAESLSHRDKSLIYMGLNQRSRDGEARFIEELTS